MLEEVIECVFAFMLVAVLSLTGCIAITGAVLIWWDLIDEVRERKRRRSDGTDDAV